MAPSRVQFTNCLSHNHALRPGACPFPKHPVLFSAIINAGYKAALCLLVISREKKRQLIKAIHILVKNLEKLRASRVLLFTVSRLGGCGPAQSFPHLSRAARTASSKIASLKGLVKNSTAPSRMA
jgi:hypothetical protein